eukprot:TRINITY_DN24761_c0_g1_i1.p1 TRINITY_DN24761_c0_g1~~TRINITY_DN24761_c0_g1_i1.p1  ORF type:complete len:728 (+),score=150.18 TRINITY_DN24761_c0_g1_i1:66-2249(+)
MNHTDDYEAEYDEQPTDYDDVLTIPSEGSPQYGSPRFDAENGAANDSLNEISLDEAGGRNQFVDHSYLGSEEDYPQEIERGPKPFLAVDTTECEDEEEDDEEDNEYERMLMEFRKNQPPPKPKAKPSNPNPKPVSAPVQREQPDSPAKPLGLTSRSGGTPLPLPVSVRGEGTLAAPTPPPLPASALRAQAAPPARVVANAHVPRNEPNSPVLVEAPRADEILQLQQALRNQQRQAADMLRQKEAEIALLKEQMVAQMNDHEEIEQAQEEKIRGLEDLVEQHESKLRELRATLQAVNSRSEEVDETDRRCRAAEAELRNARKQAAVAERQITNLEDQIHRLQAELDQSASKAESRSRETTDVASLQRQLHHEQQRFHDLETRLKRRDDETALLMTQVEVHKREATKWKDMHDQLTGTFNEFEIRNEVLKHDLDEAISRCRADQGVIKQQRADIDTLKREITLAKSLIIDLQTDKERLEDEVVAAKAEVTKFADLWKQATNESRAMARECEALRRAAAARSTDPDLRDPYSGSTAALLSYADARRGATSSRTNPASFTVTDEAGQPTGGRWRPSNDEVFTIRAMIDTFNKARPDSRLSDLVDGRESYAAPPERRAEADSGGGMQPRRLTDLFNTAASTNGPALAGANPATENTVGEEPSVASLEKRLLELNIEKREVQGQIAGYDKNSAANRTIRAKQLKATLEQRMDELETEINGIRVKLRQMHVYTK